MIKLIDTHCHIHDQEFFESQRQEIYQAAKVRNIAMITIGTDQKSSQNAVDFARDKSDIWVAVGVHPHDSKNGWQNIEQLAKNHKTNKIVAIGEIGLDYFYEHSPRQIQQQALEAQLQIASDYNLPVSFHVRDGFDDFWPIFDNFHGLRGVLHSFTDNQINVERGLSRGLFFGVNGISTFTKDQSQIEVFRNLPLSNIVLETDAPFLTPAPFRGKMNKVEYVELVAQHLANQRGLSFDIVASTTCQNSRHLFNI